MTDMIKKYRILRPVFVGVIKIIVAVLAMLWFELCAVLSVSGENDMTSFWPAAVLMLCYSDIMLDYFVFTGMVSRKSTCSIEMMHSSFGGQKFMAGAVAGEAFERLWINALTIVPACVTLIVSGAEDTAGGVMLLLTGIILEYLFSSLVLVLLRSLNLSVTLYGFLTYVFGIWATALIGLCGEMILKPGLAAEIAIPVLAAVLSVLGIRLAVKRSAGFYDRGFYDYIERSEK